MMTELGEFQELLTMAAIAIPKSNSPVMSTLILSALPLDATNTSIQRRREVTILITQLSTLEKIEISLIISLT